MILAGDIGGTKTTLALFHFENGKLASTSHHQYASQAYGCFYELLSDFLQTHADGVIITSASFGIAGPIIQERCVTTNLPWEISAAELRVRLGTSSVSLLNDLEATAYGMLYLDDQEFYDLNPEAKQNHGNRAVIAAGTGLGEAMLYFDGKAFHPIASEGGHCDFAPLSDQQDSLLRWLRLKYPLHVSLERILSGPGIATLYDFLAESGFASQPDSIKNMKEEMDKSALISQEALLNHDPLCHETLRLFSEIYGAEAGNLALKSMALGGVYVGGGIAPKILPFLQTETFFNAFVSKGRFEPMLRSMPLKISLNPQTALLGAGYFAHDNYTR